eukprot:1112051_1
MTAKYRTGANILTLDGSFHGGGPVLFSWHPSSLHIAVVGASRVVCVYDRKGKLLHQIIPQTETRCIAVDWDYKGESLACLEEGGKTATMWNLHGQRADHSSLTVKDGTFMKWDRNSFKIAVGNVRGELIFYNKRTTERKTVKTRHKKRVLCGCWSKRGKFFVQPMIGRLQLFPQEGNRYQILK